MIEVVVHDFYTEQYRCVTLQFSFFLTIPVESDFFVIDANAPAFTAFTLILGFVKQAVLLYFHDNYKLYYR